MSDLASDRRFSPRALAWRTLPVVAVGATALVILFVLPRIPQALRYHHFKDDRTFLGVPNAWNVLSNVPFFLVGVYGLWFLLCGRGSRPGQAFLDSAERWPFVVLCLGVTLTGFGSTYYHFAPDNDRLVWDRLPLTLGFMGIIAAMLSERISVRLGSWLLLPLVLLGLCSVLQWHWSEQHDRGDLRLYFFVQGYAVFFVLVTPLLFPARYTRTADWYIGLGWYGVGVVCDALDGGLYELTGHLVSGHTLKHLLGTASTYWLLRMLMKRRPLNTPLCPEAGTRGGNAG